MNQTAYEATDFIPDYWRHLPWTFNINVCLWVAVFELYRPPCVECGRYLLPVRVTNPVPHSPLWEATGVWLFRLSIMYRIPQLITVFTCFHRWFLSWARIIHSKLLANCCFNTHINIVLPCVSCVIALLVSRPKFCMNSCFRHAICIPCLRLSWLYW